MRGARRVRRQRHDAAGLLRGGCARDAVNQLTLGWWDARLLRLRAGVRGSAVAVAAWGAVVRIVASARRLG